MNEVTFDPSQPFEVVENNQPQPEAQFNPSEPFSVRSGSAVAVEERRKMSGDLKKLQAEKVSDSMTGFEKFAVRSGTGVQKAGLNARRMLDAGSDVLFLPEITSLFSENAGGAYRKALDENQRYYNQREAQLTREAQLVDDNSVLGQIAEGTSRALVEMPAQLIPGMAAKNMAQAVTAAAATGGAVQGLSTFGQERGDGRTRLEAIPYAVTSGLITALTTKAFGATGVESVFKNEGVQGVGAKILNVLKEAGMEGAEEAVDQFQQDLLERSARNPNKPIADSVKDVLMAGTIGSLVGGLASTAHTALTPESKPTDFQKAFEKAQNRTPGQRASSALAFLNQPSPTLGEAADESQSRQENKDLVDLIMKGRNENPPSAQAQNKVETPSPIPVVQGKPPEAQAAPQAPAGVAQPQGNSDITVAVPTMEFARRLVGIAPKDFVTVARNFNNVNLELGRNVTDDELAELERLRDVANQRVAEAAQKAEQSKALADAEDYGRISTLPQFFNEAIAEAKAKRANKETPPPMVPKANPNGEQPSAPVASRTPVVVSTGKPNGAKAEVEYEVVEAASLKPMIQREVNQDQTRQRVGNIASNEQIAKIATQPDPDLLLESQFSTVGAPIVDDVVIAGNGRVSGLISGYEGSTQGIQNYRRAVVGAASRLGLGDVSNMVNPILIRRVKRYTSGDKSSFVVESNPKYAMLRESVSESAMLDAQALGDISAIPFTDGGALTADGVRRVAQLLDAAQRSLERTTGGDYNASEANRRVQLAALAMMGKQENVPVADFIGLLESDEGRRVIGEVIRMSPRMVRLDADLQIGGRSLAALREFQTGLASVRDKAYNSLAEWYAARRNELLKSGLDENAETILKLMVDSQQKAAMLRAFFDEYITEAEYEQNQRNEAGATADIFGEKRQPKTAVEITSKILNPNAPVAPAASGGQNNPVGGGKGPAAVRPDVNPAPFGDLPAAPPLEVQALPTADTTNAQSENSQAKPVEPFSTGSKVRVGKNPQPHTILRETTDPKFPDERIFEIQNDRTKEKFEIEQASLTPISERTAEERESSKPKTKKELQDELLKLNPALRPSIKDFKTTKQLRDAIKRERAKRAGDEPAANLGVGLPEGAGWDEAGIREAIKGVDVAGFQVNVITRAQAVELTGKDAAAGYGGFFYRGQIYIVADNVTRGGVSDLQRMVREEVGHGLLRTPEGLRLITEALREGELRLTKSERDALLAKGYQPHQLLDEFIAQAASQKLGWWQNIVETVRAYLSKFGLKLTNEETARLLVKRIRNAHPDAQGNIPGERFVASNAVITSPDVTAAPAIVAHHGTPHKIKGAFSTSRIGTGEGAQAFGWGLYFAENEKVATQYQKNLTEKEFIGKVRELYDEFSSPEEALTAINDPENGFSEGQRNLLKALQQEDWLGFDYPHQAVQAAIREPQNVLVDAPLTREAIKIFGNRYTVSLDVGPDGLLDWDVTLKEQNAGALSKIAQLVDRYEKHLRETRPLYKFSTREENETRMYADRFYKWLGDDLNRTQRPYTGEPQDKKASRELARLGIKGIRYLDQGSRKAGSGTYNYVIFDDSVIKITHENGQPVSVQDAIGEGVSQFEQTAVAPSQPTQLSAEEIERINRELNRLQEKEARSAKENARIRELEKMLGQRDLFEAVAVDAETELKRRAQREEIARRQNKRLVAGQIEDQGGLFAPKGETKQVDMFSVPPPKTEAPPAPKTAANAFGDLFGELAPSRAQFRGVEGIGAERGTESIGETRAAIKERVFNATPEVTDERTDTAWRIANELTEEVTKAGHALRYRSLIGGQEMGLPLLKDEVVRYAIKLAAAGNDSLLRFSLDSRWQTVTGGDETTAGRTLRAARELSDSPAFTWLQNAMGRERAAAVEAGARVLPQETFLQLVRDMENLQLNPDELEAFLNRARDEQGNGFADIVAEATAQGQAPQQPGVPRQPRQRGAQSPALPGMEQETDEEAENAAQNTANRILEQLQIRHAGVEWLRPDASLDAVREIVRIALRGRLGYAETDPTIDPILDDPTRIVEKIQQALENVGVETETARALGREIESERQNRWANRRVRQIERAARSNSVRSLIEDILNTPYRAQHDPAWRRQMAIRWFQSNGLSSEQASAAADLFNREFEAAYQRAAEKVAARVLRDGAPKTNEQFERLIRSGVLDPSKPWLDKFAEASGWVKPTPEQFQKIAELEEKLADPELSPSEIADIIEQQRTILRHVGKKDGAATRAMAESFTASLLSQAVSFGRTFWVQFAPVFFAIKDFSTAVAFDPRNALNFADALVMAYRKQGKNQLKYGWQKDAYQFHINDITGSHNELKRVYETTQKLIDSDATPKIRKAAARVQQIYALGRFVFRLMNTIDNTQMSIGREWKIVFYASRAFKEAGIDSPQKISQLIDAMNSVRQSEFDRALDAGLDEMTAGVRADHRATQAALDFVSGEAGGDYALKVLQAAENDIYNVVGRRAPGIGPNDEGLISRYTINPLMDFASNLRKKGGLGNVVATVTVGMVNIPLRAARAASDFYGYGLIRYGIHKYRVNRGMDTYWKQSFANELQAKQRRNVAIAGLALAAISGLNALKNSTADDDANKRKNGIFVTGSGPKSKNLRDEWIKNGWSPYTLHILVGGVKVKIPLTRVGEPLFPPFLISGVIDNVKWAEKDARSKGKEINLASVATQNLIAAHAQLLGARGIFQSLNQYQNLTEGGGGLEKNLARMIGGTAAAIAIPFKSSLSQISEMLMGPLDNSSATAILINQLPLIGRPWQKPALNRFGDLLYNQTLSGKLERAGIPFTLQIPGGSENERLYTTLVEKGIAPPELRRYVLEERFGDLTDSQFSDFATKSGALLKQATVRNLSQLQRMTPDEAKKFLQKEAQQADNTAAAALGLERKAKPASAPAAQSGASSAQSAQSAAPSASVAPVAAGGGSRMASGRIRSSLASFKVPRLKKVSGRIRSRISRGFKRPKRYTGRIRSRVASIRRRSRIRFKV